MQLFTENLPSGYSYDFVSLEIKPMTFAQILEYVENYPNGDLEKYYFDYCTLRMDDPDKVDKLLVPDLEYCIFLKKALSISKDTIITSTVECPHCKSKVQLKTDVQKDIHYSHIDQLYLNGCEVKLSDGNYHRIKIPTIMDFLMVFKNYRRNKKITDLKLIKIISLFEDATKYPMKYEDLVLNAKYEDITLFTMLSQIIYELVDPRVVKCPTCAANKDNTNDGGIVVEVTSLITDFFRDVLVNNGIDDSKIVFREIPKLS